MTAPANATIDDTIRYADAAGEVFRDIPDTRFTFQLTFPDNGFGGMVLKPWGVRKTPTAAYLPEVQAKLGAHPRHSNVSGHAPRPSGRRQFPLNFVIASTADPERILEFAKQIQLKAMQSGMFRFADVDTKIDQPQSEIVFDHDKVAAMGLNMQQVGADLSASIGGNFVNRFNIAGRSYKVIPQIKRIGAPESAAVGEHLRQRPEWPTGSTEHGREDRAQDRGAFAQSDATAQRGHD